MQKFLLPILLLVFSCEELLDPDTTAPTVVIAYPSNNSTLDSTTTVRVDVSDDSDIDFVKFIIDGRSDAEADSTAPYEYEWDVCVQASGTHTLMAKASDTAGNEGQSDLLTYTINASYDCEDVCGGDKLLDNCEVCDADTSNDCPADCNGDYGGDKVADNCGTCDNDSTNDCSLDACGIWGGDGYNDAGYWCEDYNILIEIVTINSITTNANDLYLYVSTEWDESGRIIYLSTMNSSSPLTILPESIGSLEYLKTLKIMNPVTSLPQSIGNLSNLENLYISSCNNLLSIPQQITNLTKLTTLRISIVPITSIPDSIGKLINLENVTIRNSQITSLPESFGNLNNLKELDITNNKLTSLPENFGNLNNLNEVLAFGNQLTTLPESIGNLTNLIQLSAHDNNLVSIPESICNLSNANVQLGGNKLCEEFNFECTENWGWGTLGLLSQDQSNCCEGENGEPNWTQCP